MSHIDPGADAAYMRRRPGVPLHTAVGEVFFRGTVVAKPVQLPNRRWIIVWPADGAASRMSWSSSEAASDVLVDHYSVKVEQGPDGLHRVRCWCGVLDDDEFTHPLEAQPRQGELLRNCEHGVDPRLSRVIA